MFILGCMNIIIAIFVLGKYSTVNSVNTFEICLDCIDNLKTFQCNYQLCNLKSYCINRTDLVIDEEEISSPSLVCKDENSLTFTWTLNKELQYFMEFSTKKSKHSKMTEPTLCNYITINGLESSETYSLYLFGFSLSKRKLYKSREMIEKTSGMKEIRTSVKDLHYGLTLMDNSYMGILKWKPGADSSCYYEIVWYGKEEPGDYIHRKLELKKAINSEFNITNLEFGRKYHLSVASVDRNSNRESPKKWLKLSIPSCLETYRNLSICPPNKPANFIVMNISATQNNSISLTLSWKRPEMKPDFYRLTFIRFNESTGKNFTYNERIPGAQSVIALNEVDLGTYYIIKLVACSKGGESIPAYIRKYHQIETAHPTNIQISRNNLGIEESQNYTLWIWSGLILMFLSISMIIFRKKLKKCIVEYLFLEKKLESTVVRYTNNEAVDTKWELVESKLLIDKILGVGAFGIVQKGYYYMEPNKKMEVAVKTLKAKPTEDQITEIYEEIEIMKSVPRHAHIVYLIGVITKNRPSNPLMLVEYCSGGDLQTFLRKVAFVLGDSSNEEEVNSLENSEDGMEFSNKSYDMDSKAITKSPYILEPKDLLSFARQIVVGMEFLSSLKVLHRDLAARNVLISARNTLKISDFGLSRDIYTNNIYKKVTGGKLPFRWMALESLTHQVYTTESDVWSFGIVLWEIVTLGGNPYPTINTEDLVILLKSGYRMEKPVNCSEELYQIMLDCWQTSPNLRPSFKELREIFDKMLESEMQYISLEDAKKLNYNDYENTEIDIVMGKRYIVQERNPT